nr:MULTISPECIES: hypothetical protein [unclassified Treponema]
MTTIDKFAFENCKGLTSAVFADTNGWAVNAYEDDSAPINEEELKDPKTAASFLSRKYFMKYWKKN